MNNEQDNLPAKRSPFFSINLGHILIISTWVSGVLVTYGAMEQKQNALETRVKYLEVNHEKIIAAEADIRWLKREFGKQ